MYIYIYIFHIFHIVHIFHDYEHLEGESVGLLGPTRAWSCSTCCTSAKKLGIAWGNADDQQIWGGIKHGDDNGMTVFPLNFIEHVHFFMIMKMVFPCFSETC